MTCLNQTKDSQLHPFFLGYHLHSPPPLLCSHTSPSSPSSSHFQPSSASADGSGFNKNNRRAWWGPPGVHAYAPRAASVYEWADNCPSPDKYSWRRAEAQQVTKLGERLNMKKATRTRGGEEKEREPTVHGLVCWAARQYWQIKCFAHLKTVNNTFFV